MGVLIIDGSKIPISHIDLLLLREIEGNPGMIIHLSGGETSSCQFPSIADQQEGWEMIRIALGNEDFYECQDMFFRKDAVILAITGEAENVGPYVQMGFRGGMLLRRPFPDKAMRDLDFSALQQLLGHRQHNLH